MVFRQQQQGHMARDPFNQMMRPHIQQPPPGNSGIQQMIQRLINPSQAGGLLSESNVSGLSNTLNNVQQILKVVQTAAPMVQEYGPMVKNLPAMYKMLKALQETEGEEEVTEIGEEGTVSTKEMADITEDASNDSYQEDQEGESTPRLYI